MDTIDDLRAERAKWKARLDKAADGPSSHSVGDRSYTSWSLDELRRQVETLDRQIAQLSARTSGYTLARLRRGR